MSISRATPVDPEALYSQQFPLLMERAVTEFNMDSEAAARLVHDLLIAFLKQRASNPALWLDGALTVAMRRAGG